MPVFKSRTDLVLVPVIVREHGKPVTGLAKDKFVLKQSGKSQSIDTFEEVRSVGPQSIPQGRNNRFLNHLPGMGRSQGIRLIVIDVINTPALDQSAMRRAIDRVISYLSEHLDDAEPTALMLLTTSGLRQIHSFTHDPQTLTTALKVMSGQAQPNGTTGTAAPQVLGASTATRPTANTVALGPPPDKYIPQDFIPSDTSETIGAWAPEIERILQAMSRADAFMAEFDYRRALENTLASFEQIALAYAGVPGRKSLLWVSYGFEYPMTVQSADLRERIKLVLQRLAGSNVAVYPIDIKLLDQALQRPVFLPTGQPDPSRLWGRDYDRRITMDPKSHVSDSLALFAAETGARACLNENEIKNCVERAHADSSSVYMLGFYVPAKSSKPGWHKLSVDVNAPGVQVLHRPGYWVGSPDQTASTNWKETFAAVAKEPFDFTDVPIQAGLLEIGSADNTGKHTVKYSVQLPPSAFLIGTENGKDVMEVQVSALAFDKDRKYVTDTSRHLRGILQPATKQKMLTDGLSFRDSIDLAKGSYELKIVVRDNLTGKIGSVTVPVNLN